MPYQNGPVQVHNQREMSEFDVEVSYGAEWVSLNDQLNFRVAVEGFGNKTQTRRRITAASPYYDGTFVIHTTQENVEEAISVWVYGTSQNHVTENLLMLETLFDQATYNIRVRMDDHQETWLCWPADYSIDRSHVMAHNVMALMKLTITRMPAVSYEVIL